MAPHLHGVEPGPRGEPRGNSKPFTFAQVSSGVWGGKPQLPEPVARSSRRGETRRSSRVSAQSENRRTGHDGQVAAPTFRAFTAPRHARRMKTFSSSGRSCPSRSIVRRLDASWCRPGSLPPPALPAAISSPPAARSRPCQNACPRHCPRPARRSAAGRSRSSAPPGSPHAWRRAAAEAARSPRQAARHGHGPRAPSGQRPPPPGGCKVPPPPHRKRHPSQFDRLTE